MRKHATSIAFKGASVLVITAALILECATIGTEISEEESATLYAGAWLNPEYQPLTCSAPNGIRRIVTQRDGTFESYRQIGDALPEYARVPQFAAKWRDADGNTWYRCTYVFAGDFTHHELGRINPTREVFERLISLKPLGRWAGEKSLEEYAPWTELATGT